MVYKLNKEHEWTWFSFACLNIEFNQMCFPGYTPALACAPNKDVADCLALILSSMMPISPSSTGTMSSLTFTTINHYSSPSKTVTFDPLPVLRSEHVSYCKFTSLGREDELNDSDSETYWQHTPPAPQCLKLTPHWLKSDYMLIRVVPLLPVWPKSQEKVEKQENNATEMAHSTVRFVYSLQYRSVWTLKHLSNSLFKAKFILWEAKGSY